MSHIIIVPHSAQHTSADARAELESRFSFCNCRHRCRRRRWHRGLFLSLQPQQLLVKRKSRGVLCTSHFRKFHWNWVFHAILHAMHQGYELRAKSSGNLITISKKIALISWRITFIAASLHATTNRAWRWRTRSISITSIALISGDAEMDALHIFFLFAHLSQ